MKKKTCTNCDHYDVCGMCGNADDIRALTFCLYFKDKSCIIETPCKVGDVVYCIATVHDALHPVMSWGCCEKYRIVKCTCKSIDIHLPACSEYNPQIYCTDKTEDSKFTEFSFLLKPEDFGKTVFFTKEKAEAKLKELNNDQM